MPKEENQPSTSNLLQFQDPLDTIVAGFEKAAQLAKEASERYIEEMNVLYRKQNRKIREKGPVSSRRSK